MRPRSRHVPLVGAWAIAPSLGDGLASLTAGGDDLEGSAATGIYTMPVATRLRGTDIEGIYTLEG